MTKLMKRVAVAVLGVLVLIGLAAAPQQHVAAKTVPSHVNIVLHKLLFDDNLPASEQNNGKSQPSFDGQSSRPLNGVTFTAYDITRDFWRYMDTHDVGVEKAQNHFAEASYEPTEKVASQVTAGEGEAHFDGLSLRENGRYSVYLFKETGNPAGIQGQSQNLVVVLPVLDDGGIQSRIDLFPKNVMTGGKTVIEKKVNENRTNFAYGQKIPYKISVKVPADIGAMKDFSISDSAASTLRRVGGLDVKIDGHEVTGDTGFYHLTSSTENSFAANFNVGSLIKYANKTITITYNMAIRPGTAADKPLVNDATVYPGGGQPKHDYAVVVTGGKRFVKVNAEKESVKLSGATFVVKNAVGAYLVKTADGWDWKKVSGDAAKTYQDEHLYTLTSNAKGAFGIQGLAGGAYELYEVRAPTGFLRNKKPIPFMVVAGEYTRGQADPYKVVNVPKPPKPGVPVTPGEPGHPRHPGQPGNPGQPNKPFVPGFLGHLPQTGEEWASWLSMLGLILIALIAAIRVKTKKSTGESKGERK